MAKILHTADFHLDSAFTALPEEKARLRRQEARQLTDRLVDYANDHGVELLLLAGDLFDSDQLYGQTAQELARSLARFRGHAVIAPGNHDFYAASSPYARPTGQELRQQGGKTRRLLRKGLLLQLHGDIASHGLSQRSGSRFVQDPYLRHGDALPLLRPGDYPGELSGCGAACL